MNARRTILFSLALALIIGLFVYGYRFQEDGLSGAEKYSQVKIFATGESDFKRLEQAGLDLDHVEAAKNYVIAWLSAKEIEMLKTSGVGYQVTIDDWMQYYNTRPVMDEGERQAAIQKSAGDYNVTHSIYGSMGGYLTYQEVINKLDSMRLQYPGLISAKFSIGNSFEGREQWTVRVSNSPDAPTGRPEAWFHSLIHAREPESMEQNIYFIYWLLENYNIDPYATYILRYRELYFTPVFNPDGYEYNRSTNPNGGGFWRLSRKPCSGGLGADLNRNYGPYEFWNFPGGGSSEFCGDETFRGDLPFDQSETQNAMNFVNSRNFTGVLSYHTFGNYFIRPYGYSGLPSADENIFQNFSADMALQNQFTLGRSLNTVGYTVRGTTDDWYYTDSGHTKIIAMTPEVGTGSDGFWPPQNRILPLAQSTVWSNIYFALSSGGYVAPLNASLSKISYNPGEAGSLKINFKNKGLLDASNVKIELVSQSPFINVSGVTFSYNFVTSYYQDSVSLNFNVLGSAPLNKGLPILLRIKQNDTSIIHQQKIYVCIGNGTTVLSDSAENGSGNWTFAGGWGTTTSQSYSPPTSFTESPTGNYSNFDQRSMTLAAPINTSSNPVTILSYYYRHDIEPLDNAYIQVSSNNGTDWVSVKYYYGQQLSWKQEVLDITELANGSSQVKVRYLLITNRDTQADGIYLDNIKIQTYQDVLTGVTGNGEIPNKFALEQNYPNPFNPVTNIKYQLPKSGFVILTVFDALGRVVKTLVNENKEAGNYQVSFDGTNLSSGVYFYRIEAGDFKDIKKMILIK
ncbi:MAG: M14 family zinc carboxypeptidase [Ignavibacteria bacterium]